MQQDCSCDCCDAARRGDLGDASNLRCRISVGMLELASDRRPACSFSPIWTARLRALACIFAGRLAHVLAGVCWFSVSRGPFSHHHLFCDAVTGESRSDTTESRLEFCHVEQSETSLTFPGRPLRNFQGFFAPLRMTLPGPEKPNHRTVCQSECAD
jgi:hypothetical protein